MKELERVNTVPKFRQFITEEQDKEFILNSVRYEGEKRGEKRGEKNGILKSKIETAKNMLKEKMNVEVISRVTGLSINQIKNIAN